MTPALRKRHQQTWWFLGLALVFIWGTSMLAINKNQTVKNQASTLSEKSISMEMKKGATPYTQSVIVQVKKAFASPQTLVYLADKEVITIKSSQLLGRIDGIGTFEFSLDSTTSMIPKKIIKGYDAIHQKELFSVVLTD